MRRVIWMGLMTGLLASACGDSSTDANDIGAADSETTPDSTTGLDDIGAVDSETTADAPAPDTVPDRALDTVPDGALDTVPDGALDTAAPETIADTSSVEDTRADTTPLDGEVDSNDAAPDPALTGPFAVVREVVTVAGFSTVLFVPEATEPVPAIVLAPGFQLDGSAFEIYGAHLASHGIATLIPTFGDNLFAPLTHSALADDVVAMVAWLATDARIDATRLGAAGHSRGGKLAILATTRSSAIKATFGLDPVDTPGGPGAQPSADNPSVTPELMAAVTVPFAVLGSAYGGTATSAFAPACAPAADNYHQYAIAAANAPARYEWLAPGSGHNDFADPVPFLLSFACQAGDDPPATRALAKTRLVQFFKRHLAGDLRYTLP